MSEQLLQVKNLVVNVEDTEILHGIDLEINRGETHVLMGPNGAGKSTLGYALMGSPRYQLTNGQIWFKGQDITEDRQACEGWSVFIVPEPAGGSRYYPRELFEKCVGTAHRTENPSVGVPQRIKESNGRTADGSFLCRP